MSIDHQNLSETPHHFLNDEDHSGYLGVDGENNDEMVEEKYLGIDFGRAKVGLALADSETKMAFVYKTIENNKEMLKKMAEIVAKKNIRKIIIGIPSYKNGETIENEAKQLGEFLQNSLKIEVFYQNEMFTSKMAQANLKEGGFKNISKSDDQESARIILQEWLDNN
jgi:putative Holliday junction resolvase